MRNACIEVIDKVYHWVLSRGKITFSSSSNVFFKLYRYDSKPLRALIRPCTFLSSSANSSASRTMRSISSSDNRPLSAVMVIFSALPVPLSAADTALCCVVSCRVVLCRVVLCCVVLRCVVLYCVVSCCVVLRRVVLCCDVLCCVDGGY